MFDFDAGRVQDFRRQCRHPRVQERRRSDRSPVPQ